MPASVPTAEEFAALAGRVTALEQRDPAPEPEPDPGDEDDPAPDPDPSPDWRALTVTAGPQPGSARLQWPGDPGGLELRSHSNYDPDGHVNELGPVSGGSSLRTRLLDGSHIWWLVAPDGTESARATLTTETPAPAPGPDPTPGPANPAGLITAVRFDDAGFTGFRTGNSGFRQWANGKDSKNRFELVEVAGQKWGCASLQNPAGRAEGIVAHPGVPASTMDVGQGDDLWFGDTILIGDGTPDDRWNVLWQLAPPVGKSPPVSLGLGDGQVQMHFGGYGRDARNLGPIDHGRGHRYVWHVVLAQGGGYVEAWRDGEQVLTRFGPPLGTLLRGQSKSYVKAGYYRDPGTGATGRIHHRDLRIGRSKGSVE